MGTIELWAFEVFDDFCFGADKEVIELLCKKLSVEMATEHDFLIGIRVKIIDFAFSSNNGIQFFNHKAHCLEFVEEIG